MKRKGWITIAICVLAALLLTVLFACGEITVVVDVPDEDDPGQGAEETVVVRTVEIVNGETRTVRTYSVGETVKLKAELSANSIFVCWTSQGVPFSFEKETTYTVSGDAVVRAVYAATAGVTLDPDGGVLPEHSSLQTVVAGKEGYNPSASDLTLIGTGDSLIVGFPYVLPIPTREQKETEDPDATYDVTARYAFDGWYVAGEKKTTENGYSIGAFTGEEGTFVAVYKEKPYVTVTLIDEETGETLFSKKAYREDGTFTVASPERTDRECTALFRYDEEGNRIDGSGTDGEEIELSLSSAQEDEVTFGATYREAYAVTVLNGTGTGKYGKEEEIPLAAIVVMGDDFVGWTVKLNAKAYYLASQDEGGLCLLANDAFIYYDEEKAQARKTEGGGSTYQTWLEERNVRVLEQNATIRLADLEKLGVTISGTNVVVKAGFKRQGYAFTYVLECEVNGRYCLDAASEIQIESLGFVYDDEDKTYTYTQYYKYKDEIAAVTLPTVPHYNFNHWQNAEAGEATPVAMPEHDVTVVGTFSPELCFLQVSVTNASHGKAQIGQLGDVKSTYREYGTEVEFYVTANSGYRLRQWLDNDNNVKWRMEEESEGATYDLRKVSEERSTTVTYVFTYPVTKAENLVVDFSARNYTITYLLSVTYDGEDVTQNPAYFEENGYEDGYWRTTEERNFGTFAPFKAKQAIKGENQDGLALLYGAENWEVTDWMVYGQAIAIDPNGNFTMPDRDVVVTSTCRIREYTVNVAKRENGVDAFTVETINGKSADEYRDPERDAFFVVPYASTFTMSIRYATGYSYSRIRAGGADLTPGDANAFSCEASPTDRYEYEAGFTLTRSGSTTYELYARQLRYKVTYYVAYDYLHGDEEKALTDYISFNSDVTQDYNGTTYYLLTGLLNGSGDKVNINSTDKTYEAQIGEATVNAAAYQYVFSGWTKVCDGVRYDSQYMPDEDLTIFGDFSLKTYTMRMGRSVYKFDGAAGTSINSVNVVKTTENGVDTTYGEGDYEEESTHAYFTAYTLSRHIPTGYDFVTWQIFVAGKETTPVAEFEYDTGVTGIQRVETADNKVFKYAIGEDGQVIVYLTENSVVTAKYSVKTFTATATLPDSGMGTVGLTTDGGAYANWAQTTLTFEYRSPIRISYNGQRYMQMGKKITGFLFKDENGDPILDGEGEPILLDTAFDQTALCYGEGGYYANTALTTALFTQNVTVEAQIENVSYYLTYRVYTHVLDASELDTTSYVDITTDENGERLTVPFQQQTTLYNDAEMKVLAASKSMYVTDVMHSGWYNTSTLTTTITEGQGYSGTGGAYRAAYSYRHNQYAEHAILCSYFMDLYKFTETGATQEETETEIEVNPIIRNTPLYKTHFSLNYRSLTLPSVSPAEKDVVIVAKQGFSGLTMLESVALPETVTKIKEKAFMGCSALTDTGLNDTVTRIEADAYKGCTALTEVYLGAALATIGDRAFEGTTHLATVEYNNPKLAAGVAIGANVFRYASTETADGIEFIVGALTSGVPAAFFNSSGDEDVGAALGTLRFAESDVDVTIQGGAFYASGLHTVVASTRWKETGTNAFRQCARLTEVDLCGSGLTTINEGLFRECSGLTEVILPSGITTVRQYAFMGCVGLTSVYYEGTGPSVIGSNAFSKTNEGAAMALQRFTSVDNKAEADEDDTLYREVVLTALTTLSDQAFRGCPAVTTVRIGGATTTLGTELFLECSGLKTVVYGVQNGEDRLDDTAMPFTGTMASGVELEISEGVARIPNYAFGGFSVVTTVRIPTTVTALGARVFNGMSSLTAVEFNADGAGMTVGEGPFIGAGSQEGFSVTFGSNVTSIVATLFYGAGNLKTVSVEEGDEDAKAQNFSIGTRAFATTGLTAVTLPERNRITFGENAFQASPVANVTISDDVTEVLFYRTSLSSKGAPSGGTFTLLAFGKEMNTLIGTLSTGTFLVQNTQNGLRATLSGVMATAANYDFVVGAGETMVLSGASASRLTVTDRATVYGTFRVETGATAVTGSGAEYFRAVAATKEDFLVKNAATYYTHLRLTTATTFDDALAVSVANLELLGNVTFAADATISSSAVSFGTNVGMAVGSHVCLNVSATALTTTITAQADAQLIVGGKRYFYDTEVTLSDLAVANTYGLRIGTGSATLVGNGSGFVYNVPDGAAITTEYPYSDTTRINFLAGSTMTATGTAEVGLSVYSVASGAQINVRDDAIVTLAAFTTNCNGSVDADAHVVNGAARIYYAKLLDVVNAIPSLTTTLSGAPTVYLDKNVDNNTEYAGNGSFTLNFNGKTMTLSHGLSCTGTITLVGAALTVTSGTAVTGSAGVVMTGGSVTSAGTALYSAGGTVSMTNATVTSAAGAAVQGASVTASGSAITGQTDSAVVAQGSVSLSNNTTAGGATGIALTGQFATLTLDAATVTASTGYGARIAGENTTVVVRNGSSVTASGRALDIVGALSGVQILGSSLTSTGAIGVYLEQGANTMVDLEQPVLTMDATSTIAGIAAGLMIRGSGYYVVNGALTSTQARNITYNSDEDMLYYTGALVVVDGNATEAGYSTWSGVNHARVAFGGEATNASGDAILFVGIRGKDVDQMTYDSIALTGDFNDITGRIAELLTGYGTPGEGEPAYVAESGGALSYSADGSYVLLGGRRIPVAALPVTVDSPVPGSLVSDVRARYFDKYASVSAAFAAVTGNEFVWVDGETTITGGTIGGTVFVKDTLTLAGTTAMSSGNLVLLNGGKLSVTGTFTYSGTACLRTAWTYVTATETVRIAENGTFAHQKNEVLEIPENTYWTCSGALQATMIGSGSANNKLFVGGALIVDGGTLALEQGVSSYVYDEVLEEDVLCGSLTLQNHATLTCGGAAALNVATLTLSNGDYTVRSATTDTLTTNDATLRIRGSVATESLCADKDSVVYVNAASGSCTANRLRDADSEATGLYGAMYVEGALNLIDRVDVYGSIYVTNGTLTATKVNTSVAEAAGFTLWEDARLVIDGSTAATLTAGAITLREEGAALEVYGNHVSWVSDNGLELSLHEYAYAFIENDTYAEFLPLRDVSYTTGKIGYVSYCRTSDYDSHETYTQTIQRVVDDYGKDHGSISMFYKESDRASVVNVVEPSCFKVGYTASNAERGGTLYSGCPFVVAFERKNIRAATGAHTFVKVDDESHACSHCGNKYAHTYDEMTNAHINEVLRQGGSQMLPLAWYCSGCGYSGKIVVLDETMTVADFNALEWTRRVEDQSVLVYIDADASATLGSLATTASVNTYDGTGETLIASGSCVVNGLAYEAVNVKFRLYNEGTHQYEDVELGKHCVLLPKAGTDQGTYYVDTVKTIYDGPVLFRDMGDGANAPVRISGATTEAAVRSALPSGASAITTKTGDLFGNYRVIRYDTKRYYLYDNVRYQGADCSVLVECTVTPNAILDTVICDGSGDRYVLPDDVTTVAAAETLLATYSVTLFASNENGYGTYRTLTPTMVSNSATDLDTLYGHNIIIVYDALTGDPTAYAAISVRLTDNDGFAYPQICHVLYKHTHSAIAPKSDNSGHYCTVCGLDVDAVPHAYSEYVFASYKFHSTTYSNVLWAQCPSENCPTDGEVYTAAISNLSTTTRVSAFNSAVSSIRVLVNGYHYSIASTSTSTTSRISNVKTDSATINSQTWYLLAVKLTATDGGVALSGDFYVVVRPA